RRIMTTTVVVPMTTSSNSGLVVIEAAAANPIAHAHQAMGCRSRGSIDPITSTQPIRRLRVITALVTIAAPSSATTPQVTTAGTRAGSSGVAASDPAPVLAEAPLDAESLGDSRPRPPAASLGDAEGSLDLESLGDSGSSDGVDVGESPV